VELCLRFYADEGRPGLLLGRYFPRLLMRCFEGLGAELTWMLQRLADLNPSAPTIRATMTREVRAGIGMPDVSHFAPSPVAPCNR
jgi:hypothetical protein